MATHVKKVLLRCLVAIAAAQAIVPVGFSLAATEDNFYSDSGRVGYWWYQDPPKEEEKKKEDEDKKPVVVVAPEEKKEKSVVQEPPKRVLPKFSDHTYEEYWNMHPADFRKLLDDFRDKAVMTLDPQDIKEYKTLQDLSRRKAVAYMNVDQVVTQQNPDLSLENEVPYVTPGRTAKLKTDAKDLDQVVKGGSSDYGLLFFYSPDNAYCDAQANILGYFHKTMGWEIKNVNVNEKPEAASMFNVEITPTLVLVRKGKSDYFPVSSGVIAMDQLKDRLYGGMRILSGEATVQQYGVRGYQIGGGMDPYAILNKSKKKQR